jgi:hypothetical protein
MGKQLKRPSQKTDSQLLSSLKVLSSILKDDGSVLERNVLLKSNWATATNGILSIGEPIQEDMTAAPNGLLLREALAKCGASFSITELPHTLEIKGGRFKAVIPCIPPEDIQGAFPDPAIAACDDRLKASLLAVAPLALDENSVVTASVLIAGGTVTATDRKVIIQHWHGIDLPVLTLPKTLIKPLIGNTKKLVGFGYSNSSCTFHFEDKSWIKSQYFAEQWPDINAILNKQASFHPVPDDFYNALEALEKFSEDGFVRCLSNKMISHDEDGKGASYEVYGLPEGPTLNIKQMKIIKGMMKTVNFRVSPNNMMMFKGDSVRGAIAGRV